MVNVASSIFVRESRFSSLVTLLKFTLVIELLSSDYINEDIDYALLTMLSVEVLH